MFRVLLDESLWALQASSSFSSIWRTAVVIETSERAQIWLSRASQEESGKQKPDDMLALTKSAFIYIAGSFHDTIGQGFRYWHSFIAIYEFFYRIYRIQIHHNYHHQWPLIYRIQTHHNYHHHFYTHCLDGRRGKESRRNSRNEKGLMNLAWMFLRGEGEEFEGIWRGILSLQISHF